MQVIPVAVMLDSSMTQLVYAKIISCIPSIVSGNVVPTIVKVAEAASKENPVISASGVM